MWLNLPRTVIRFVFPLLWIVFLDGCKEKTEPKQASGLRNLLLITLDTTRADRLGSYGYARAHTPHLDRLAAQGVRFTEAVAHVPLTRPSHATILTGLLPQRHGIWSNGPYRLDPKFDTLASQFKNAGYHTAAIIASIVLTRSFGFAHHFDYFDDRLQEVPGTDPEKNAETVASVATTWLGNQVQPPFFLWIHFYDPHFPYAPPEPWKSEFADSPYDGEIAYMDDAIGKILGKLETMDLQKETLILVAGDHGESLGEHYEPTHGYLIYDSTIKVPLILSGPGMPVGKVIHRQVALSDLYPTVLEAFHLPSGGKVDGHSFWNKLQQGNPIPNPVLIENRTIHYQFGWAMLSGVRTENWKWIFAPNPELYDLKNDPHETTNLLLREPKRAAEMKKLWGKIRPPDSQIAVSQISPEEMEKLESLGYTGSGPEDNSPLEKGIDPKEVADLLDETERLIRLRPDRKYEEMEALVHHLLSRDPNNLFAKRVQGEILLEKGNFEAAYNGLKEIVITSENHPETLAQLATACERTGRLEEAIFWYEKASSPPAVHWPALEALARISMHFPQKKKPSEVAYKLQKLQPISFRERISAARALAILSLWEPAKFWYERALELNSRSNEALVGLAEMEHKMNQNEKALETLKRVQPPTTESHFVMGQVLDSAGRQQEACSQFVQSIQKNPVNVNLLFGLGYHLSLCKEIKLSISAYQKALQRDPGHPDSLYNLAQLEEQQGRRNHARELYSRFLKVAPPRLSQQKRIALEKLQKL